MTMAMARKFAAEVLVNQEACSPEVVAVAEQFEMAMFLLESASDFLDGQADAEHHADSPAPAPNEAMRLKIEIDSFPERRAMTDEGPDTVLRGTLDLARKFVEWDESGQLVDRRCLVLARALLSLAWRRPPAVPDSSSISLCVVQYDDTSYDLLDFDPVDGWQYNNGPVPITRWMRIFEETKP